jgi:polysaccharide deacetylase family protein (PEP-CTERM system associated)
MHIFSIDVEDYYHVSNFDSIAPRESWEDWEQRVESNTNRMLDLLDKKNVKSFCYVLGWVAERYPDLVRRISQSGHIVGSHTYWHRLVYQQGPTALAMDLSMANEVLSSLSGQTIRHFRAPSFSIKKDTGWAVALLRQHGFEHDSSVVPIRHDRYGIPDAPLDSYTLSCGEKSITEHPVSVLPKGPLRIPIGGGGYFRIFPWWFTRWGLKQIERSGRTIHFYIHPWEIDPEQPKAQGLGALSQFRHYRNLNRCYDRLGRLFDSFAFGKLDLPKPKGEYHLPG